MSGTRSETPEINPWLIAAAVILPTFMEVLDTTITSVSLPHIAGNLAASNSEATWVQTSYLISNAVVLPASAWFSSFFGRKRFLLACIVVFTLASFACGIAPTMGILLLARIVQGAGGGALQPISQAILLESFPPAKHGAAMAAYALGVIIAPVIGPILGGWVTDNYSWRWLFYMNLPIGALAVWMVRQFVFDPDYIAKAKPGKIDKIGLGLLTLWLGTMQTVLDKGQDADWFEAKWICWFSVISALAFVGFIFWELREKHPVADLRVFKDRNFTVGTILISIASVIIYGPMTLMPLFLQGLLGYNAFQSGLAQVPRGFGMLIAMPLAGHLVNKIDSRKLIGFGFLVTGLATHVFGSWNLDVSREAIFWPNFSQGIGLGFCMVPLMAISLGLLSKEQMGNAAGIFALARNLAGSIGISLVTTFVSRWSQKHQAFLVAHATPYDWTYQNAMQTAQAAAALRGGTAHAHSMALGGMYQLLLQHSGMLAYVDDFRFLALICFLVFPGVFFLRKVVVTGPAMAH
jgi:DHA2 family multidrug resistance protein